MKTPILALSLAAFTFVNPIHAGENPLAEPIVLAQTESGFQQWIKGFRVKALANGISANTFKRAFRGVTLNQRVIALDRKQAEFSREIWDYLDTATSPKRVKNGKAAMKEHRKILKKIEKKY